VSGSSDTSTSEVFIGQNESNIPVYDYISFDISSLTGATIVDAALGLENPYIYLNLEIAGE